jgi:ribosomal protein S18 acetylase RimI-like enzyme
MSRFVLERGFTEANRTEVVALLREYEQGIGLSLCFQNFDAEVAGLPGNYGPPRGIMVFARDPADCSLIGCVALRPFPGDADTCEMKRLYVRRSARATGLGRTLAQAIIEEGARLGYRRMCLDTLPEMTAAQSLYGSLGFRQTGTSQTEPKVLLFERDLTA